MSLHPTFAGRSLAIFHKLSCLQAAVWFCKASARMSLGSWLALCKPMIHLSSSSLSPRRTRAANPTRTVLSESFAAGGATAQSRSTCSAHHLATRCASSVRLTPGPLLLLPVSAISWSTFGSSQQAMSATCCNNGGKEPLAASAAGTAKGLPPLTSSSNSFRLSPCFSSTPRCASLSPDHTNSSESAALSWGDSAPPFALGPPSTQP
mmetsp:Transcript_90176/g.201573  ORF Transcript_90176/g.201573 Transcript_90176/m.201573 type:complete len:207 (-) Transcript_90176:312-932(-)